MIFKHFSNSAKINRKKKLLFLLPLFLISFTWPGVTEGWKANPLLQPLAATITTTPKGMLSQSLKVPEAGTAMPLSVLNPIKTAPMSILPLTSSALVFPLMITPSPGGSLMNEAGVINRYTRPLIYNTPNLMPQPLGNPLMINPLLPQTRSNPMMINMMTNTMMAIPLLNPIYLPPLNPGIASYMMATPRMANPLMVNQMLNSPITINQMLNNHVMINQMVNNPWPNNPMMIPTLQPRPNFPLLMNGSLPIMNGSLPNNPFISPSYNPFYNPFYNPSSYQIDLPPIINSPHDYNPSMPSEAIINDLHPHGMLILLEKCSDVPDELMVNKKGRMMRIEHYTIHGTKALFTISVPDAFMPYDRFGKRKHFYDPKTGKTIAAVSSGIGLTVSGSAPDIKLDPYPVPDYAWWYGCSPTSAGIMMGYYDWNGYPNMVGTNVPDAEVTSFSTPFIPGFLTSDYYLLSLYMNNPLTRDPPFPTLLGNKAISSAGHITDFWSAPESLIDPLPAGIPHTFDCLADFMGTNQLNLGTYFDPATGTTQTLSNADGQTTFWWYNDGTPLTSAIIAADPAIVNSSGMYGMIEYARSRGYTATAFNQRPDTWVTVNSPTSINPGFSFLNFKNEISAGKPVLLHLQSGSYDHTVLGFGYYEDLTITPPTQEILLRDTWTATTITFHSMPWGGTYPNTIDPLYPLECYLITSFTITSAPVP